MTTYIGVLRAINLGSHNKIAMSDLRAMMEKIGLEDCRTLILSGNIVFRSATSSVDKVEKMLEAASTKHLGVTTDYFVRSVHPVRTVIEHETVGACDDLRGLDQGLIRTGFQIDLPVPAESRADTSENFLQAAAVADGAIQQPSAMAGLV